ncbi:MAG: TIGR01777 family oxidoreductase [Deltaproteobacteria bacterium]|nr:TIGR01777 family oxidoreductase [Deltaproteobacteria bacterium]
MTDVVLTGGTGMIGARLAELLRAEGRALRWITRDAARVALRGSERAYSWNGTKVETAWLDGAGAVVHLAGEPIFGGLPTAARRERIWSSRIDSTRSVVDALAALPDASRPRVFVCASAVGYYADSGDDEIRESDPPGPGFISELCRDWEAEAARARALGVRVCSLRIGVVLARSGGALGLMLPIFRAGLGGKLGDGRQWFPWIHLEDCAALMQFALTSEAASGAWNCTAPGSVRNAEFSAALAKQLHRPAFFAVPAFAVRTALRDISTELLASRRIVPAAAQSAGFTFRYPTLDAALSEIVAK